MTKRVKKNKVTKENIKKSKNNGRAMMENKMEVIAMSLKPLKLCQLMARMWV